jgi:hypothetical protein
MEEGDGWERGAGAVSGLLSTHGFAARRKAVAAFVLHWRSAVLVGGGFAGVGV